MKQKQVNAKELSAFESPEQSPGYLLWRVSTLWRSQIEAELKQLELTHSQFVILTQVAWLTQDGNPTTQIEVGRYAGLDPNTTSQVLRGLEAKNLIKRVRTVDERSKNPTLTAKGFKVIQKALPLVEQADQQFFNELSDNQQEMLITLFQKLVL